MALPQAVALVAVGFVLGVPLSIPTLVALVPVVCIIAVFGGAFGILVLSNLASQRTANQVFPFVMLPQFFLAGVFNPLHGLPWFLDLLSRVAPMRYAVDLLRNVYYGFQPTSVRAEASTAAANLAVIGAMFAVFMVAGTALFVRSERNR